jgi:hypothetical protein
VVRETAFDIRNSFVMDDDILAKKV